MIRICIWPKCKRPMTVSMRPDENKAYFNYLNSSCSKNPVLKSTKRGWGVIEILHLRHVRRISE